jgi:membrane-bound lytic murein transglycosylase B
MNILSGLRLAISFAMACALCANPASAASTQKKHSARASAATGPAYARRADVMAQVTEMAARNGLNRRWARKFIGKAHYLPAVVKLILPPTPGVAKNWRAYRERFVEPKRIQAGVRFWQTHADALARAEKQYGVPAEVIMGIIGVESFYGQQAGTYRVLDALATLAFDFPKAHPRAQERSAFFKSELEQFLLLNQRSGTNPMEAKGSYAGAMGLAQFMPSSWIRYAVDFNGDGKIDLFHSPVDAIGSVANYFTAFHWQSGMPAYYPLRFDAATLDLAALLLPDLLPTFSVADLQKKGVILEGEALQHQGPLALIELQNGDPTLDGNAPTFVAGTENFYVITRYNWSSYYAMAVIELGHAVAAARAP